MNRSDRSGLCFAAVILTGLILCRRDYMVPRKWVRLCAAAVPLPMRLPRAGPTWLEHRQQWAPARCCRGCAFPGGRVVVAVAAVALGAVAVVSHNAT
jgi:hypothetical protein